MPQIENSKPVGLTNFDPRDVTLPPAAASAFTSTAQINASPTGTFDQIEPPADTLAHAKFVLESEADAIAAMATRLDAQFARAIDLLFKCSGKVVVTGMGKSGHIGCKIAATFASTGTPAFFVHPAELRHGDFGMLDQRDLVVALSGSGETQEIKLALDPIKRMGIKIIALTGNATSTLAKVSDAVIDVGVEREACPLNLAPTCSTTAALAMGDALAIVLMTKKGFKVEDYARSHPGGSLGKRLITVGEVMRFGGAVPAVALNAPHNEILTEISSKRLGFTTVLDQSGKVCGIITDGDLRRAIIKWGAQVFGRRADEIMTHNPKTISSNALAVEALNLMEKHSISALLILNDNGSPVGLIDLKDLLHAGII
jgi:arabinose-5-phosphate isomerase